MTQAQAIERGFTHFIEVWRARTDKEGFNYGKGNLHDIYEFDENVNFTRTFNNIYTVCVFLCKLKPKQ